jgi:hypothetical protein
MIETAWHQVTMSGARWDPGTSSIDQGTAVARRGFVRFEIAISGGPPWRVTVVGYPNEILVGTDVPSKARDDAARLVAATNRMILKIHDRLDEYAVKP